MTSNSYSNDSPCTLLILNLIDGVLLYLQLVFLTNYKSLTNGYLNCSHTSVSLLSNYLDKIKGCYGNAENWGLMVFLHVNRVDHENIFYQYKA